MHMSLHLLSNPILVLVKVETPLEDFEHLSCMAVFVTEDRNVCYVMKFWLVSSLTTVRAFGAGLLAVLYHAERGVQPQPNTGSLHHRRGCTEGL